MIRSTPLSIAASVNGQVVCDCGCTRFQIGLALNGENSFIRILQCVRCDGQMLATHKSSEGLLPALANG